MKLILVLLCVVFSMSVLANVNPAKICSQTTTVCAAYQSDVDFTTTQEGRFRLSLSGQNQVEANLLKVDLWMQMGQHGHGSSPLKVIPVAPGEFDVTKAFFVMRGAWQIRVTYKQGSVEETLIIPVLIKK